MPFRGLYYARPETEVDLSILGRFCIDEVYHTFGSQLAQKGESLYKISKLMGNSSEICRRHYAALIPEEMRDTVEFDAPNKPGKPVADIRKFREA